MLASLFTRGLMSLVSGVSPDRTELIGFASRSFRFSSSTASRALVPRFDK